MMGGMISRGRVAVVLGRRGFSAILLAVAGLVVYTVFLAVLATEPSAQTDGNDTGDEGCPNPDQIDTFTGTENQITPDFNITGNTFGVSYEITDFDEEPGSDSFLIRAIGEDGFQAGDSVLVFDEGSDSVNILEGPGDFSLEIESEGFEYTVTVEDCVGTNQDNGNQNNDQNNSTPELSIPAQNPSNQKARPRRNDVIRNTIPRSRLPPTGGLSTHVMVTGSILVGAGLLGLGLVVRRGSRD
jgi:hypothetical protein